MAYWLEGFQYRIKLTVADTNVDSDLTNFPVLVYLSAASGVGNVDVSAVFDELTSDANRKKIAITTDDFATQCYVEIEKWDDANEQAWLWVRVPSILATGGATLYLYYDSTATDNTTYVGDIGDAAAQTVWDSDHVLVCHMAQDPNGDVADAIKDSTSNTNHGTPSGTMLTADLVDGLVGKGIDFDGGDDLIDFGSDAELDDLTTMTLEVAINPTGWGEGNAGRIIAKSATDNSAGWQLIVSATGPRLQLESKWDGGSVAQWYTGSSTLSLSTWQSVSCTYDSTSTANDPILYIDGTSSSITESPGPSGNRESDAGQTLKVASRGTDREFYGLIDEVRVSKIIRSAAWLKAVYYSNTDALITFDNAVEGWLLDYSYRIPIALDKTNVDSDLSNFPVLLYLSSSSGITSADLSGVFSELPASSDRKKLAVTTSDGYTQCYVEIEKYDTTTDEMWLWVKVPTVYNASDTSLYLYYDGTAADNTTYVGDTTDAVTHNVWDSNFVGVWHLGQDPNGDVSGAIKDSTSSGIDATPNGTMTSADLVAGEIGEAIDFDGSDDYLSTPSANDALNITTTLTLECIFKPSSTLDSSLTDSIGLLSRQHKPTASQDTYALLINPNGLLQLGTFGGNIQGTTSSWSSAAWHHVAGTFNSTGLVGDLFANGVKETLTTNSYDTMAGATNSFVIAHLNTAIQIFAGIIDEVRVSNVVRSDDWIKATYYSSTDALATYSASQTLGAITTTVTLAAALGLTTELIATKAGFANFLVSPLSVIFGIDSGIEVTLVGRDLWSLDSRITKVLGRDSSVEKITAKQSRITKYFDKDSSVR